MSSKARLGGSPADAGDRRGRSGAGDGKDVCGGSRGAERSEARNRKNRNHESRLAVPFVGAVLMPLKFFIVPVLDPATIESEINAFLGSLRVVAIDRRFVEQGSDSFWAVCVDHLPSGAGDSRRGLPLGRSRIDYKQVLSADEFVVFSRLRELRKEIAQREAVPVYAVFTNEQLAQAVQQRCRSATDLGRIDGVGHARVEKYADQLLGILASLPDVAVPEATDAAGEQSV